MEFMTPEMKKRGLLLLLASAIIFTTIAATRITYRRFQLNRTLSEVEQEIADLEAQKAELTETLSSFNEFATIEQAAREVLNLQREGEQVVILLPNGEETTIAEEEEASEEAEEAPKPSNPVKWWGYFFGDAGGTNGSP